jgi:hypothetical protein
MLIDPKGGYGMFWRKPKSEKHPAYKQGIAAFRHDQDKTCNPYDDDRKEIWQAGWDAAEKLRDGYFSNKGFQNVQAKRTTGKGFLDSKIGQWILTKLNAFFELGFVKSAIKTCLQLLLLVFAGLGIMLVLHVGIALFGQNFKATSQDEKLTENAQAELDSVVYSTLNDFSRFELKYDHSIFVYMDKKNYMNVPFPDRKKVFTDIATVWCKNDSVTASYLPKVVFKDIRSGETLESRRCLFAR